MNTFEKDHPPCPKCGFMSIVTDEKVELPDGSKVNTKVCMEKNCDTLWVEHHEKGKGFFILHVSKNNLYGYPIGGVS